MREAGPRFPEPDPEAVLAWASRDRDALHDEDWITVNRTYHGIAMGARRYANARYPNDPEQRAAFFDGLTMGLVSLSRQADIDALNALFAEAAAVELPPVSSDERSDA